MNSTDSISNKALTVFTPTYNRAHLLPRLYESLRAQTSDDFMWLIVDDCSTDNTEELINGYALEGLVDIKYIKREINGGKMRAHNDGVRACDTPYFLCVDSDDYLVNTAVSDLINAAGNLTNAVCGNDVSDLPEYDGKYGGDGDCAYGTKHASGMKVPRKIAGVIAHKGSTDTELLSGVEFPAGVTHSTLYNLYLNGFKGETTIMFVTDVIRSYPFPEIEGEKYVPEDYIYDKIDRSFEYIILNKIITVCELVAEGYTDSVIRLKHENPQAFYMLYEQRAIITPMSLRKIKYAGFYVKYAGICGRRIFDTKLNPLYVIIGALASVFINE